MASANTSGASQVLRFELRDMTAERGLLSAKLPDTAALLGDALLKFYSAP